jgi:hypothetical protein
MDIARAQREDYKSSTASKQKAIEPVVSWGLVPPAQYKAKYPSLTKATNDTFFKVAFGNGEHTHGAPLISRSSVTTFPKVYSFDDTPLQFLRELASELNKELPVSIDSDLFSKTGIHTPFDRLKCPAGFFANPMSYVSVDNSTYRSDELKLRNGLSDVEAAISKEVWHLIFKEATITPVNVAKLSTGGMRRFTHDVQWKLAFAEWLFEGENFERMLNAVDAEDSLVLANEFETIYAMYLQKRGQVDSPDKVRMVIDREYAVSGGNKGKEIATDKRVVFKDGRRYDDFSAIRARVVQAGPWSINCFLQIVSTCAMHSMFERFPKTFHINTRDQIKEMVDGKHIFCSDVTEYDRSMPAEDIRLAHDVMAEYWDERIVKASWRLYSAPYYSKPLDVNGGVGSWVGDPTDWSFDLKAGNRSGHALTSLVGKVNKVIETLCLINKLYPVLGHCRKFLEGRGPMGVIDNGDDEITWSYSKADLDTFKLYRADLQAGRYVVKPEVGQGYSGLLLCRDDATSLVYRPTAKIHTTFEKLWVPERSIGGLHRKYWTIGVIDRISNITSTEIGRTAWDIHMSVYRRMMAPLYGDFMGVIMMEHSKVDLDMNSVSAIDKEVLDEPGKLHYKYLASDVSANVLSKVTSKIPISAVEKIITKYYKGLVK